MALVLSAPTNPGQASWTDVTALGVPQTSVFSVTIAPADTIQQLWFAPFDLTVTGIKLYAATAPSSPGGTYLFTAGVGATNLLSPASFSLETLVSATLTSMTLSAVAGALNRSTGDVFTFSFASNNADLEGAGLYMQLIYMAR